MEALAHEVLSPEALSALSRLALKRIQGTLDKTKENLRVLADQREGDYCEHEVRKLLDFIDGKSR